MTSTHPEPFELDSDTAESYRHEITGALNSVVRACADIARDHSHRGFWTPTGTDNPTPDHHLLIELARTTVLNKLRMVLKCADTIAHSIELDEHRRRARHERIQSRRQGE
ncbi:hypothetical protein [Streptomyces aidingensis]|uniref:Uncharacterized protein n=1 Tax=Streptomyces aidingensis TaxID=910347 RepID=A0A1I1UG81_9ACTN|nr:hypothetical protein [Streptomyces aidingensis]SFD69841.1 hypothetical protein SAMN05421773_12442 [Streptomyces aidingensis]